VIHGQGKNTEQLARMHELMTTKVKLVRVDPPALGPNVTDPKRGL